MMITRLIDPSGGKIVFDGTDIGAIPARQFASSPHRRRIQMVFQDPTDSLNPRFTAERAIADPIMRMGTISGRDALRARCEDLARLVGLPVELIDRFPHQLSGGQKARVGIARAIALDPDLVILDEPTAALDARAEAEVFTRFKNLAEGTTAVLISHRFSTVRMADRIVVLADGKVEEQGTHAELMANGGRYAELFELQAQGYR
jgi:peptide/nickel transport system ATP-binding protein